MKFSVTPTIYRMTELTDVKINGWMGVGGAVTTNHSPGSERSTGFTGGRLDVLTQAAAVHQSDSRAAL